MRCASLAAVLILAGSVWAGEPISLETAIDMALRQNSSLRLAALRCESRRVGLDQAKTAFTIKVTPDAQWRRANDSELRQVGLSAGRKTEWGSTLEADVGTQQRLLENTADYHRDRVRIRLTQPLLQQFGPLINAEPLIAAERDVIAAERELELRKVDVVLQVVETYESLLLLQQQEAFDQVRLRRLERMMRLTEAKEKQGRAGRVDVLRVQLQYGEAESRLNQTRERLTATRAELAELLGLGRDAEIEAQRSAVPDLELPDYTNAVSIAACERLDYALVLADCEDAARGVKIARRRLWPDLRLVGEYEKYGEGASSDEARKLNSDGWFVGLTLASSDLLRRDERAALRQAVLNEATAREAAAAFRRALERQVRQALAAYQRSRAEWPLAERNYVLAETRMRVAQRLFEMGKGDSFSVSDAEEALLQAQNRLLAAQSDAVVNAYRLLRTLGRVLDVPEHLKPRASNFAKKETYEE